MRGEVARGKGGELVKAGRFLVSAELLHQLLLLPTDARVCDVRCHPLTQQYELIVAGNESSGLPEADLSSAPLLKPSYQQNDGVARFVGWR